MDCYLAEVKTGELVLKEHEAARWLLKDDLDSIYWLPADRTLIDLLKKKKRPYVRIIHWQTVEMGLYNDSLQCNEGSI